MERDTRLVRRVLPVAGAALAALGLTATAALADDWGQRVPGQHVYDTTGTLTAPQVSDLEQSAAAVDRAGAPTIVYVRRKDADDAAARQDARALMDAWGVESAPGQQNGFVLLLDLQAAGGMHGSAALVAGASLVQELDDRTLQGIYDGTMKPRLAAGDLAGALSAALARVAADLRQTATDVAPVPRSTSADDVAGALIGLGVVVAAVLGFIVLVATGGSWSGTMNGGRPWSSDVTHTSFTDWSSSSSTDTSSSSGGASSDSSSGGGSF